VQKENMYILGDAEVVFPSPNFISEYSYKIWTKFCIRVNKKI